MLMKFIESRHYLKLANKTQNSLEKSNLASTLLDFPFALLLFLALLPMIFLPLWLIVWAKNGAKEKLARLSLALCL